MPGSSQEAEAVTACTGGVASDFNGDGLPDLVMADPMATVSGLPKAGLVNVILGGGKGTVQVSQDLEGIPDGAEAGDQFGFSFAVYDANKDGCSDLAVGIPYEDVGTVPDAGFVQLVYGSTSGLGTLGAVGFRQGADGLMKEVYEAEDWVGYSVATTVSKTGVPNLIIGAPGEDVRGLTDSGLVTSVYESDFKAVSFDQDSPGVWETSESYDQFGASLVASGQLFVVGAPGESIDTDLAAGAVLGFRPSINTDGIPAPAFGMGQARASGSESSAEHGDRFGTSMAIAPYRPSTSTAATDWLLAVGAPSEDLVGSIDAGAVMTYHITAAGGVTILNWIDQNTANVEGAAEPGDFFGQRLTAANTSPTVVSTASTMRLAVGVPGEESSEEQRDKGGVHNLPMVGAPGASDTWMEPGIGIPETSGNQLLTGISLGSTRTALLVGLPYGPSAGHAVYGFAWSGAQGAAPTQTWRPGDGIIPVGDGAFGTAIG
ncbi:VCBS repeat-containing protein [Streptomyces sp. NPDC006307]|uniref:FG-GAP repeat domain-containing protein n=1 Tax=Streptomyces sp. NPDC006307 TaxID=3156748 RepID=UPI0033B0E5F1